MPSITRSAVRRRLLSMAAIAGLATATAGCQTTGTGLGLTLVSDQQVVAMSQDSWKELRAKEPASGNAAFRQTAQRISQRLLAAAGKNPAEWEVVVFKSEQINAFALPNRKIGVYEGMMKLAGSDAELAAVIGHEIGHVEHRHSVERVNSQVAADLGVKLVSTALGSAGAGDPETISTLLGMGAQYGLLLPYSRNQELDADIFGLYAMAAAGYDPRAAVTLWRKMQAHGGQQPPVFMSTHPATDQRIGQLQAAMPRAIEIYRQHGGKT